MNKGIFITGTDTGVGKTYVAIGLIKTMKEKGLNFCPMKPVETGCRIRRGELVPEDSVKLMEASGVNEPIDLINPYRLKNPLAPSVAADIERVHINRRRIFSVYNRLLKKYDFIIVEGAGGIMVPMDKKYLFLDLIKDFNLPVVIVSRPGLGTINHTLLTIKAIRNNGLNIFGVIINYTVKSKKGLSEKTNPEAIEKLGGVPILGIVPYSKNSCASYNKKIFTQIAEKILSRL